MAALSPYVAEHVSDEHRGYYTGWLQTSPTLGIVLSIIVIIAARTWAGEDEFNEWAWRIPFLFSFLLMFIAYYIRVHFQESPIFEDIKAKAAMTKNPWKEAFLSSNIKLVGIANIVVLGQGVVWYSSQFWPLLYFLPQGSKLDLLTTNLIVGVGLVIGMPLLQRIPVKLTRSLHVGSNCGILHGKLSLRKHQRVYIEQGQSVRQTSADML